MAARKAPLIRCQCGRQHRSWNPHKVCNACVRDALREVDDGLAVRVRALETRHERLDVDELRRVHERWLARQPVDHPWRAADATSTASRPDAFHAGELSEQLTIDATSRVAGGGGEA